LNLYTFHISLYDLAFLGTIFIGLNFSLLLWITKKTNWQANRFLSLVLAIAALWMVGVLGADIRLETYLPHWNWLPLQFSLALGPLIYFYVLKLTQPEYKFRVKDLLHFTPLLLQLGAHLVEVNASTKTGASAFHLLNSILMWSTFISVVVYLYRSHRLIKQFYQRQKFTSGDRYRHELRWLHNLLLGFGVLWVLWLPISILDHYYHLGAQADHPLYLLLMSMMIWMAARAYLRPEATVQPDTPPFIKPMLPADLKQKGIWLKKIIKENRYYEDPELTLNSLAKKVGLHTHELSRVINTALKKNFFDLINEYRVQEAIRKMQDPAYEHLSLLGIALESGFNSQSTFSRIFKQMTGKSPLDYKNNLKKDCPPYNLRRQQQFAPLILQHGTTSMWSPEKLNRNYMFRNYLKIAWRNILRNKFYAFINIIGLTVGLTFGLLILLWVNDEFSFDAFHTKADRIYKINAQLGTGSSRQTWPGIPAPTGMHAAKDVPEVEYSVRIGKNDNYSVFRYKNKLLSQGDYGGFMADPTLFKVFDYKLLKGNVNNPFPTLNSIIITETTAKRFFGDEDPIGKVLQGDSKDNFTVTGVLADFPENSSFKADMLFSFELARKYFNNGAFKSFDEDWGDYFYKTFVLVKPHASAKVIANKLTAIHLANQEGAAQAKLQYVAQPLLHLHLYNTDDTPAGLETARIFLIVALLIVIIACINYINLSTARAMLRSKEVSVRKIIGAERKQLFTQFIIETTLFFVIAVVLSLLTVKLLMPVYNSISGKEMQFDLFDASVWKVIGLTIIGSLAASSIYPAILLSSFKPISALKGVFSLGVGNTLLRKSLVVTQFIFSIVLIIGTLIIRQQLNYIRQKDLGYDKSYTFSVGMGGIYGHYDAVRTELMSKPGVIDVTRAGDNIVRIDNSTGDTDWDGKESKRSFLIHPLNIDETYINFFKLKIVAGRAFRAGKSDSASYILNETAVKEAGIKDPIGKRFTLHSTRGTIIGVVKDFYFASMRQKIEPAILCDAPQNCGTIFVRTTGKDAQQAVSAAEHAYKAYNPVVPYSYEFLDADFDALYKTDQRAGTLFSIFAGIAIFISCLGLLGLATYTAQVKVKEIGIRKVLGASVTDITGMLSKDFLKLVVLSFIIATPIAWYAMYKWLQDYAYPIKIQWWVFAIAGISAIAIAFITISSQAIKAALTNPVKSLRNE